MYLRQQSSLPVHSSDLKQSSFDQFLSTNHHITTTNHINVTMPSNLSIDDEPIYYYTIAQGNNENLPLSSVYENRKTGYPNRTHNDLHMNQYCHDNHLKSNTSTSWMASSLRECDAYRPDSTIDPNCYCCYCIDRSQNLTTTFQSQSNSNVWQ
uniref:Ovule protein n=1 Tax=Loa loa TaxID=7209 RepID=A0A1I7VZH2_LOALO